MLLVHRNPHGVGFPFSRRLLPLARLAHLSLGARVRIAMRQDPSGLVLVSSFLDEPLPLGELENSSTAAVKIVPSERRRAAVESFGVVDSLRSADASRASDRRLRYRGIDLLDVMRWEAHYPVLAALDFTRRLSQVLVNARPSSLVALGHPSYAALAEQVATAHGVPSKVRPEALPLVAQRSRWRFPAFHGWPRRASSPAHVPRDGLLLFANGRGSALNAAALAAELKGRGHESILVARGKPAKYVLAQHGRFVDLDPWIGVARTRVERTELNRLKRSCDSLSSAPQAHQAFQVAGTSLWEACGHDILRRLKFRIDEVAALIDATHRLVQLVRPKAVVLGFDAGLENRVLTAVAREHGVASVSIQDGVLRDVDLMGLQADLFCADNQETWQDFVDGGVAAERIQVTGQPRLDAAHGTQVSPTDARRQIGVETGQQVAVLFASTGEDSASDAARKERDEAWVVQEFGSRPGWTLIIKLHPHATNGDLTLHTVARLGARNVQVLREPGPDRLLPAADLVLCVTTTTAALEALRAGKPVFMLDLDDEDPMPELVAAGAMLRIRTRSDLAKAMDRLPSWAQRLTRGVQGVADARLGPADGRSAARVADVVLRAAGRSPR